MKYLKLYEDYYDRVFIKDCFQDLIDDGFEILEVMDEKGRKHIYKWINGVQLNGREDALKINYVDYKIITKDESGEEKERIWVGSIMRCCVPGGEIEVRELVELLKSQHKLSADTIRSNVMSVLRDSSVFKKGIVKWVNGISKFIPPCQILM